MSDGMNRREFLRYGRTAVLGASLSLATSPVFSQSRFRQRNRPNILLITADDLGIEVGCYGDTAARTPHIDRFAREGVRFQTAYVSQASCSPSRSSILTGLFPHQNRMIGLADFTPYHMRTDVDTLPAMLRDAGYRTGIIGKLHLRPASLFPFEDPAVPLREDGTEIFQTADSGSVMRMVEMADAFFSSSSKVPFFLYLNLVDPHRPFHDQMEGLPERPMTPEEAPPLAFQGVDTQRARIEAAGYYNSVSRADAALGLILERLAQSGKEKNTLVIFLGDNGPDFTKAKCSCYEAGLRVPLLMRWPGQCRENWVCPSLVSAVDLMPTILEAAGIEIPAGLAGKSLMQLIRGESVPWRKSLCAEYSAHGGISYFPQRCCRDQRYKLIHNLLSGRTNPVQLSDFWQLGEELHRPSYAQTAARWSFETWLNPPSIELYDLENDPHEFCDVAHRAEFAQIKHFLMKELLVWREQTADPLLDARQFEEEIQFHIDFTEHYRSQDLPAYLDRTLRKG